MQGKCHPAGPGGADRAARGAPARAGSAGRSCLPLGLGAGAIEHRVRSGRLTQLGRGVYSVGVPAATQEGRWLTAVLACPDGTVLSHLSAAALWRLRDVDPQTIDVSVPARSGKRRDGIRVHRPRRLDAADVTRHRGRTGDRCPSHADRLRGAGLDPLARASPGRGPIPAPPYPARSGRSSRSATRAAQAPLGWQQHCRHHDPGTTRTRSPLEEEFFLLVRSAGLPQPEVNVRLGPYTVDFLWRHARLVVETDGGRSHDRETQRNRDARRDAWLEAAGYRTQALHLHAGDPAPARGARHPRLPPMTPWPCARSSRARSCRGRACAAARRPA